MTQKSAIDWANIPDLGKVFDSVIAERLGCAVSTVCTQRLRLGIQALTRRDAVTEAELFSAGLGVEADRVVAERLGWSVKMIYLRRIKLGVEAGNPRRSAAWSEARQMMREYSAHLALVQHSEPERDRGEV